MAERVNLNSINAAIGCGCICAGLGVLWGPIALGVGLLVVGAAQLGVAFMD